MRACRGKADVNRRIGFIVLALAGVAAVIAGIKLGDPETIHRFAAQI
ncbi:MAG: hypothetical protein ABIL25_06230 [candidate division WOR-3 bacterium]